MDGPSAIWATRIHWLKHEITLHYDTLADTSNLFLLWFTCWYEIYLYHDSLAERKFIFTMIHLLSHEIYLHYDTLAESWDLSSLWFTCWFMRFIFTMIHLPIHEIYLHYDSLAASWNLSSRHQRKSLCRRNED